MQHGFIIFISYIWVRRGKKVLISNTDVINESISANDIGEVKEYTKFMFNIMLKIELTGIILLTLVFIPRYGLKLGMWYSIFHTISAFSNSGLDIIGADSFCSYSNDIYFQLVMLYLMISGSIGMIVLSDIKKNNYFSFSKFKLQSKLVLIFTMLILILPVFILKVLNPDMSILNLLFMSAASRSTGFAIVDFNRFSDASKLLISILMFIGGGPSSTAGGIRVLAFAIIILTVGESLYGKSETVIFWKKIPEVAIRKAFSIFFVTLLFAIIGIMLFSTLSGGDIIDITVQCISALTNTGFSAIAAEEINIHGEIVLMCLMYIGRIGLLTMPLLFLNSEKDSKLIIYPEENVIM